jgi:hypothetical protein
VPSAGVTFDAAGNMYGTTRYGGPNGEYLDGGYGDGMVWEITASGKYLDLHDFGGAATDTGGTIGVDGNTPLGGVTFDKDGNMYGTVEIGSPNAALDNGMVWSLRAVSLNSVTVSPAWVVGGNLSTGTVSLNGPANSGGLTISLSSNNVAAKVPSTVTIPSGLSSANFAVDTVVVSKLQTVTITAKGGSVSKTVSLTVNLPVPASVTFDPSSVTGGASSVGAVTLMGPAGKDGALVKLTSKSKSATVPVSVNVRAGQTTSTFTVRTYAVPTQETATISASLNGISQDASLTIYSPALVSIKLNLSSVKGGKLSTGKVTLSGPAPERGIKVSMSSSSNLASVPATLLIPAGGTSVGFTVKTKAVSSATSVTITANLSGVTKSAILTLTK